MPDNEPLHPTGPVAPAPGTAPVPSLDDSHVDGNAVAGPLSQVFALDATVADCRCGHCGTIGVFGATRVYTRCPGNVVRCATCGEVLMRITELPGHIVLDLGGGTTIAFPRPPGLT